MARRQDLPQSESRLALSLSMRAAANPVFDHRGDPDVMSLREVRALGPASWFGTRPSHQLSSCYRQKRWAEAGLHPLHSEFTSEVGSVGRPHKGTLVCAGHAVGAFRANRGSAHEVS